MTEKHDILVNLASKNLYASRFTTNAANYLLGSTPVQRLITFFDIITLFIIFFPVNNVVD